jgi:hypothetical protein
MWYEAETENGADGILSKKSSMAGLAGGQTRPIARAHHKTHDDDVQSFASTRGRAWMSLDEPAFWDPLST